MIKRIIIIMAAVLLIAGACAGCGGQQAAQTGTGTEAATGSAAGSESGAAPETAEESVSENASADSEAAEEDLSQYAGEYVFYGTYLNDYYVIIEDLEGTSVQLNEDGTCQLNWGEKNDKADSKWTAHGNNIQITDGESVITGLIKEGVLVLYIGDPGSEFLECYVTEDADTSKMPRITAEEWAKMVIDTMD